MLEKYPSYVLVGIVLVLTLGVYAHVFDHEFVTDDHTFVLGWEAPKTHDYASFFKGVLPLEHQGVYRPLRTVFYAWSHVLYGENPFGWHAQGVVIHLICTVLVFFLLFEIAKSKTIAFFASLLFGLHPAHIEAITYVTTSMDIFGVIFFLASFYFYVIRDRIRYGTSLAFAFAVLAFFTYELTLMLPFLLVLYELCFGKHGIRKKFNLASLQTMGSSLLRTLGPYFALLFLYFVIRQFFIQVSSRASYLGDSFFITFLVMIQSFAKYIITSFVPYPMQFYHSLGGIMSYHGDTADAVVLAQGIDFGVLVSFLVVTLFVLVGLYFYRREPLITFCVFFLLLPLAPIANIIPTTVYYAERYLYIPTIGSSFLLAYLFTRSLSRWKQWKIGIVMLMCVVALFYGGVTYDRNLDWKDSLTFWTATVAQEPGSAIARNNLAQTLADLGRHEEALASYKKAIELLPEHPLFHSNIASTYLTLGEIELALKESKRAVELGELHSGNYRKSTYYYNLGYTHDLVGNTSAAKELYQKSIAEFYLNAQAHNNLGALYQREGDLNSALSSFERAVTIDPYNGKAHNNLGKIHFVQERYVLAKESYSSAIYVEPEWHEPYYNIGILHLQDGEIDLAKQAYIKSTQLKEDFAKGYFALGTIYEAEGRIDRALSYYEKTLLYDDGHLKALEALGRLKN